MLEFVLKSHPRQCSALRIALKLTDAATTANVLKSLAQAPDPRLAIIGVGVAGDPAYTPWLIKQMDEPGTARLAGESFSFITGIDIAGLDLHRASPEGFESGPTDDSDDDNVAIDDDEGLPWPDPVKIQAWWKASQQRFEPGVRYFMGEQPGVSHCRKVLRDGYQRQRVAAAEYLSLLEPGTPLFPTSAPAWRQQRWLVG